MEVSAYGLLHLDPAFLGSLVSIELKTNTRFSHYSSQALANCTNLTEFNHPYGMDKLRLEYLPILAELPLQCYHLALPKCTAEEASFLAQNLKKLTQLTDFKLSFISDFGTSELTQTILEMTHLLSLAIPTYTWDFGTSMPHFVRGIGNLTALTCLRLESFPITKVHMSLFCTSLRQLTALNTLSLGYFKTTEMTEFNHTIGFLTNLKDLSLKGVGTFLDFQSLADSLTKLVLLEEMELPRSDMTEVQYSSYFEMLSRLPNLKYFSFLYRRIHNDLDLLAQFETYPLATTLRKLFLRALEPSPGTFAFGFHRLIQQLPLLEVLELEYFTFAMEEPSALFPALAQCAHLTTLKLAHCFDPNSSMHELVYLRQCQLLESLHIYGRLNSSAANALSSLWDQLPLQKLVLRECFEEGESQPLFVGFSALTQLKLLDLGENQLKDDDVKRLMEACVFIPYLEAISLSANRIENHQVLLLPGLSRLNIFDNPVTTKEAALVELIEQSSLIRLMFARSGCQSESIARALMRNQQKSVKLETLMTQFTKQEH